MSVLTVIFILSAVTGIKRGIMLLSNINMGLVVGLALFVLITGPTLFLLDLLPTSIYAFFENLLAMLEVNASQGEVKSEFVTAWTMLFWAWWISWSPFVGMFIAKISMGRTIRQFVTVVVLVPSLISVAWYVIFGGTAADSATVVMGSMSQSGRAVPTKPVTIVWGAALGLIAIFLLLAGGENALSGLQSIMVACSLPFALIIIGMMVSWAKDLGNDPATIRRAYTRTALTRGVRRGIDEHGDDFVFGVAEVPAEEGAGANFDSNAPALTEWYTDAVEGAEDAEDAETEDTEGAAESAAATDASDASERK